MNFYLDFEATRFSNRIISIGCVAGNGATFDTLVKPVNKAKVDKFITELTGITNEMLADAPSADEAFNQLFDFIELNNDDSEPKYYVYGNSDAEFLQHTVKYMTDTRACICAQAIKGNLIDYTATVKKYFTMKNNVALRKIYMVIQSQQEFIQKHNALEDAMMLQTVVEHLYDKCKPTDKDLIMSIASDKKPVVGGGAKRVAPAIFVEWNNYSKWEAKTNADETEWKVMAVDQHKPDMPKYFDSVETAALWIIKYVSRNLSPKSEENINRVKNAIIKSSNDNKCRYNCFWTVKGEE
jgi:DNA polymerase III epsilon subunit-like protein